MNICLQNVCPIPLKEQDLAPSSVWKTDCNFDSPEYVLIEATSGRGKTTFLSCLYGIRTDYEGQIAFDNKNTRTNNLKQWSQLRQTAVSIVFQDLRLFPDLTARENLQLKQKLTQTVNNDEILSMAELLEVDHKLDQKVRFLSLGQQQRFAIIRALTQPFKWLLLDEPFSHLDTKNTAKAITLIDNCCKKNDAGLFLTSLNEDHSLPFSRTIMI